VWLRTRDPYCLAKNRCHPDFPFRNRNRAECDDDRQGPKTKEKFAGVRRSLDSLTNDDDSRSRAPCRARGTEAAGRGSFRLGNTFRFPRSEHGRLVGAFARVPQPMERCPTLVGQHGCVPVRVRSPSPGDRNICLQCKQKILSCCFTQGMEPTGDEAHGSIFHGAGG